MHEAWNFGPMHNKGITTKDLAEGIIKNWGSGSVGAHQSDSENSEAQLHEANYLHLNWDKSATTIKLASSL